MRAEPLAGRALGRPEGSFLLAEWTDAGETSRDRPIAGLHLHRTEDEAWYVLEGRLGFSVGGEELEAGPGDAVLVPRGTPHSYWNASRDPARYLIVMGPRTFALVEAIHAPGSRDPDRMRALFAAFESELLA